MTNEQMLKIFKKTGSFLRGHFALSSGLHSGHYLQCALFLQYPRYASMLCKELARRFIADEPTVVVGPSMGGVIVSYEMARHLKVRSLFTEREQDRVTLRRCFTVSPDERALIVEDVITTGGTAKEVVDLLKSLGCEIVGIGAIIDRRKQRQDFGIRIESLIKLEMEDFPQGDCPLCKENVPITKPGSRNVW